MTSQQSIDNIAAQGPVSARIAHLRPTKRPALGRGIRAGAACALLGLACSTLAAPTDASATPFDGRAFVPGSIVVS